MTFILTFTCDAQNFYFMEFELNCNWFYKEELSCLNSELIELVEYFGIRGRNSHGWAIIDAVRVYVSAGIISFSVLVLRK